MGEFRSGVLKQKLLEAPLSVRISSRCQRVSDPVARVISYTSIVANRNPGFDRSIRPKSLDLLPSHFSHPRTRQQG
ncbi:Uncharacterised protein r2_g4323 [Pycnogonum litorale]